MTRRDGVTRRQDGGASNSPHEHGRGRSERSRRREEVFVVATEAALELLVDLVLVIVERPVGGDAVALGGRLRPVGVGHRPHHPDEAFAPLGEDGFQVRARALDGCHQLDAAVPGEDGAHTEPRRLLVVDGMEGAPQHVLVERPPRLEVADRHHHPIDALLAAGTGCIHGWTVSAILAPSQTDGSTTRRPRETRVRHRQLPALRPLHRPRGNGLHDRHPSPRPASHRAAARRSRRGAHHRGVRERLSRLTTRRLRQRDRHRRPVRARPPDRGPARAQRGARGHRRDGQPAGRLASRCPLRRRAGALVRQGTGHRPGQRRDPPRCVRRQRSPGRRGAAHRRRPQRQVVDDPLVVGRRRSSDMHIPVLYPGDPGRGARPRTPRHRPQPGHAACGWA